MQSFLLSSKLKARIVAADFSPLFDRKIEETTAGLSSSLTRRLLCTRREKRERKRRQQQKADKGIVN